ncbi:mechanosensitive ion channel domain-containing protein [Lentisphaerota bacterium WC36G]|nr:mechanosensitive ion channel [Lentisphaerae bacterium WC36]
MKKNLITLIITVLSLLFFSFNSFAIKNVKENIQDISSEIKEMPENTTPLSIDLIEKDQQLKKDQQKNKTTDKNVVYNVDKLYLNVSNLENGNLNLSSKDKAASEEAKKQLEIDDANPEKQLGRMKRLFYKVIRDLKKIKEFQNWGSVLLAFFGIIFGLLLYRFIRWAFEHHLAKKYARKTNTELDDRMVLAISPCLALFIFTVVVFSCTYPLIKLFPPFVFNILGRLFLATAAWSVVWYLYRLVMVLDYYLHKLARRTDNNLDNLIVSLIRKTLKVFIAVTGVLFIGKNILSIDITTLLASAGVVGLAVAFAAKDTIANFFGSIMITLDRPFKHDDRIIVDNHDGVVENVGFRSTTIKTLLGHRVTIPNQVLASTIIENISERPYIKFTPTIGLTYDTSPEKVEEAIAILKEEYGKIPPCNCDPYHEFAAGDPENPHRTRVMFDNFGDFSLNIKVTAWYHPNEYFEAMKWHSDVNLRVLKRFNEASIDFAFPSSTVYVAGDDKRKLQINVKND